MSGLVDFFVPREKKFFELLQKQVGLLHSSTKELLTSLEEETLKDIKLKKAFNFIEKKSDESDILSHQIVDFLHQTFITPINREDIQALSVNINRVNDSIEKIASSILFFKIRTLESYFLRQIKIVHQMTHILTLMFKNPLAYKVNREHIEKIHLLERKGDELYKLGIGHIFDNQHSSIDIIKEKELYEISEDTIDEIKYIADIMQTILINHS